MVLSSSNWLAGRAHLVGEDVGSELWMCVPISVREELTRLTALTRQPLYYIPVDADQVDGASFASRAGIPLPCATTTLLVDIKRNATVEPAVVLSRGGTRVDLNGAVRRAASARSLSLAPMDRLAAVAMQLGSVGPVGLPAAYPLYWDHSLSGYEYVYCGGGHKQVKLAIPTLCITDLRFRRIVQY